MKYTIIIKKLAEKFIVKLPKPEKERVLKAINQLPEGNDIKELKGKKNKGLYRLRVGGYRIIYSVDNGELIVYVVDAGNRGEVYKRYQIGAIKITIQQKIKAACDIAGITQTELGKRMGMSQQTFSSRLKVGKFSQDEYIKMSDILGCKYICHFEFPDGQIV